MPSAALVRKQIEAVLAQRIPSALTPIPRIAGPVAPTGVAELDALLNGGLPLGAISELVGPECSGRTSLALSFVAHRTGAGNVCAWVDVCDGLDPESAAAAGVDIERLLWVRCRVIDKPMPSQNHASFRSVFGLRPPQASPVAMRMRSAKPWPRLEQALRATDLLLHAGGFACIVLDMAGLDAEYAARVPLATWYRYRAAAERTQASLLLLTQHPCARSSAELLLRFETGSAAQEGATVFAGIAPSVAVERRRFAQGGANVIPLRKPPQRETGAHWQTHSPWAGVR